MDTYGGVNILTTNFQFPNIQNKKLKYAPVFPNNRIVGVKVGMPASSAVDRGSDSGSGQAQ